MTVPPPVPDLLTVSEKLFSVNVAVTFLAAVMLTVQEVPLKVSQPDQAVKSESADAAAVRVTWVPELNDAEQVAPQLIPAGDEVTVPVPVPVLLTLNANV